MRSDVLDRNDVRAAIDDVERELAGDGRVLVRPSGTEPLIRVMIEGLDQATIERLAHRVAGVIEQASLRDSRPSPA
jgi:phosphoglucosamine mutase